MSAFDKKFILLLVILVGLPLALFYVSRHQEPQPDLSGKAAPVFAADSLSGEKLDLKDVIGKKIIFINFWATFCEPCRDEMPVINSIYKAADPSTFQMVSLMEDDKQTPAEFQTLLNRFEKQVMTVDFPVFYDVNGMIAERYGTFMIPESFLIDLKGNVAEHYAGSITEWDKATVLKRINELAGIAK